MISIVIPVYKTENYLPRCLDSILNQNVDDIEIIVVNDASPQNCNEIVNKYIEKYNNIKLIENKKNLGLYNTRIVGVKEATKKYIMHVDSDDYLIKNSLNKLINFLKEDDYDIVAFNHLIEDYNGNVTNAPYHNTIYINCVITDMYKSYYELFSGNLSNNMHSKIIKKSLYDYIDFVDYNLTFLEDYLFIVQLIFFSKKILCISDAYYMYCDRYDSATKFQNMNLDQKIKTLEDFSYVNKQISNFFSKHNIYKDMSKYLLLRDLEYNNWMYQHFILNLSESDKAKIDELFMKNIESLSLYRNILDRIEMSKKEGDKYTFSVIIPVFNTEKYLHRCLDSILNQNFKDLEIVIVNDLSQGNCEEIINDYKKKYNNIVYVKNQENMGSAWSRINGLSYARGKYVHFVDSDDWLYADSYAKIFYYLKGKYDVLHFNGIYANDHDTWNMYFHIAETNELYGNRAAFDDMFLDDSRKRTLWCRVFKRKIALLAPKFMPKEHLSIADDWILNLFILFYAKSYRSVKDILYYYYQDNPEAMTAVVENKSNNKYPVEKINNTNRQVFISYNAVISFLKYHKILHIYRASWGLYIDRDIKYNFIIPMSNFEKYIVDRFDKNTEEYLNDTVRFFIGVSKPSNILNFLYNNLYESNYLNLKSHTRLVKVNSYYRFYSKLFRIKNHLKWIFSIIDDESYVIIKIFGIKISVKKRK